MTTSTTAVRTGAVLGLADPATYRRTLHLLADLPIGLATFPLATTLLALSAGLAVTLLGLPVLVLTLASGRQFARVDRGRARMLLGVDVSEPGQPRGWRARLADAAASRAMAYAVLLGPVGLINGTLVLLGWTAGLAALTFPAYAWTLADPALHLGGITVEGVPADLASVLVGLLVLCALPSVIRMLARVDAAVIRALLC